MMRSSIGYLAAVALLFLDPWHFAQLVKRIFDIVIAMAAVIVLSPVFAGLFFILRHDGGPALFRQQRLGKNGKLFNCYKFRSMRIDAESALAHHLVHNSAAAQEWHLFQKLKDDPRITPVGRILRRFSLDELPQLINVLRGDMSLVGPRPILPAQRPVYAENFDFYARVRPGLTGPWQVNGRNRVTFHERIAMESDYARHWNLAHDFLILFKTFPTLFKKDQAF